jgi:hypothetical protein
MNLSYLKQYCIAKSREYPALKDDISDIYYLANDEIEDGNSEQAECYSAINSIDELIEDHIKKISELKLELKQLTRKS